MGDHPIGSVSQSSREGDQARPRKDLRTGWRGTSSVSRTVLHYGLASVLVAIALALSLLLQPFAPNGFVYLFLVAVMASAWYGNRGSGLFSVVIASLTLDYFFLPPLHTFGIEWVTLPYLVPFLLSALAAAWMSSTRKRAEEVQVELARLTALNAGISAALSGVGTVREGLQGCTEALARHLDVACARIWTLNETTQVLEIEASSGIYTHFDGAHARVPVGKFKIGKIAQECKPQYSNDVLTDDWLSDPEWAKQQGVVACAGYPLVLEGRSVGVIAVSVRQPFSEAVLHNLASIAGRTAQFIKRKQAEETLKESEERFHSILQGAAEGILVPRIDTGKLLYANPAACRMFGYTEEELLRLGVSDLHPPQDLRLVMQVFEAQVRGEKPFAAAVPCLRKDGTTIHADINASRMMFGGKDCLVGFFTDVTERTRAVEELRETNEYLENLFNYANAPIIVWDRQFTITRFNPAFQSLTGRKSEEVIGKSLAILFPPALVERSMEHIRRALEGEQWKTVEIAVLHSDGTVRTVLWNSSNVLSPDGKTPVATIAQGQDITERKRAEEALRASEEQFRELAENIPIVFYVLALDPWRTTYISPAYDEIWGRSGQALYENPGAWIEGAHQSGAGERLQNGPRTRRGRLLDQSECGG